MPWVRTDKKVKGTGVYLWEFKITPPPPPAQWPDVTRYPWVKEKK